MNISENVKRGFVTGLILIAPLAVTVFIVQLVYSWLVSQIRPILRTVPALTVPFAEPLALVALFVLITGAGLVFIHGFGGRLVTQFDKLMQGIPGISPIYRSVRQATTALTGNDQSFERVVLVRLPGSDIHTIGFITSETSSSIQNEMDKEATEPQRTFYNVFVPMAPNPMGGFLVVVPENRLLVTDLSVSEGVQLIMTTGIGSDEESDVQSVVS